MPIFYNFYILLATFYTIFGTNILIQCPVPVPVCCMYMFFCFAKNPYQTESKRDKNWRRLFLEYMWFLGRRINARRCPRGPRGRGARQGGGCALDPRGQVLAPPVVFSVPDILKYSRKIILNWHGILRTFIFGIFLYCTDKSGKGQKKNTILLYFY